MIQGEHLTCMGSSDNKSLLGLLCLNNRLSKEPPRLCLCPLLSVVSPIVQQLPLKHKKLESCGRQKPCSIGMPNSARGEKGLLDTLGTNAGHPSWH